MRSSDYGATRGAALLTLRRWWAGVDLRGRRHRHLGCLTWLDEYRHAGRRHRRRRRRGCRHLGAGHPDGRGSSGDDTGDETTADAAATGEDASDGKGAEVSELAKNPDLTGIEQGAAVSALASDGASRAGQHGSANQAPGGAPDTAGKPDGAGAPVAPGIQSTD